MPYDLCGADWIGYLALSKLLFMKHVFITDTKYKWLALGLIVFITLAYWASFEYNDFMFANIFTGVMLAVGIVAYFKLKRN